MYKRQTLARNQDLETPDDVAKVQEHNEREKDRYSNVDIVLERTPLNVHFKAPTNDYVKMFEQMEQDGVISTRGLKPDAVKYGELVFDVNSAYFYNHGGYEFAKQFYADAYRAAVEIVGGEQYILSAVMHADERNRAMSEALGEDVYHYHLHVVYIPVVEKQILWSKRCKDEALRGTVKEVITQVSRSKKWESKPVLDENGNPMLNAKGKKILKSSYSVLPVSYTHLKRYIVHPLDQLRHILAGTDDSHILNRVIRYRHPGIAIRNRELRREIAAEHFGKSLCCAVCFVAIRFFCKIKHCLLVFPKGICQMPEYSGIALEHHRIRIVWNFFKLQGIGYGFYSKLHIFQCNVSSKDLFYPFPVL